VKPLGNPDIGRLAAHRPWRAPCIGSTSWRAGCWRGWHVPESRRRGAVVRGLDQGARVETDAGEVVDGLRARLEELEAQLARQRLGRVPWAFVLC
jgi:hypothetical protein